MGRLDVKRGWTWVAVIGLTLLVLPTTAAGVGASSGPIASAPHAPAASAGAGRALSPSYRAEPASPRSEAVRAAGSDPLVSSARWFNLTPGLNPSPGLRFGGQMAYDAKDGYTVYFSGTNTSSYGFDDTWTYKAGVWTEIFPSTSPPSRIGAAMVYDPVDQCVVLYGGQSPVTDKIFGDTWEFSAGEWTNVTAGTSPGPRVTASAAWDPDTDSIILFGGQNGSTVFGDTWRFVGGTWTELFPASSPSPRVFPALAYDTADGYLLLWGGASRTGNFADTYRFSNGTWTELFPATAPAARAVWGSAYDPALNAVVVFGGGVGNDSLYFGDTWTFHAGVWTEQFPVASPGARQFAPMVWDAADNYLLIYSGQEFVGTNLTILGETWAYVAPLSLTITPGTGPYDTGQSVSFSADATGGVLPYTLEWGLGDGATATGASVTHAYATSGVFNATVTLTDGFDETALASASVPIGARPSVVLAASTTTAAPGANITLTATVKGGTAPVTESWSLGDGRTLSGAGPEVVAYTDTGTYTVNVTVTDAAGASASSTVSVTVQAPPPPSKSSSGSSVPWLWIGIALVVVVLALVAVFALRGRRSSGPPPGAAGIPPPGPWTAPPPPPPPK